MSIQIGRYTFSGPHTTTASLEARSGVYVILRQSNGKNYVLDVGESGNLKTRVEQHDRKDAWAQQCRIPGGTAAVAVLYTATAQESARRLIEKEIRTQYRPPCGDR